MVRSAPAVARTQVRRPFAAWSLKLPESFAETFIEDGQYWHAYDDTRSVSMTSLAMSYEDRRARASEILEQVPPMKGSPVVELPTGLTGFAVTAKAPRSARASRCLSGLLATDGRLLLVTITSDDLEWARQVWLSIRRHWTWD